ncbi:NtaA/DmoA family FMN-dependent monooxygenase [Mycobacterium sp. BMJ-28]
MTTSEILWGDDDAGSQIDIESFQRFAADAERGHLDALFLAEGLRLHESNSRIVDYDVSDRPDPVTRLSALAAVTTHLGLIATANCTHAEPLDLARRFSTLDLLSSGRAGWNVVTASDPIIGANFRRGDFLPYPDRYARANDMVDALTTMWASAGGAPSSARGRYNGSQVAVDIDYHLPIGPAGPPVLVQSGDSLDGREFGARFADAIFTRARPLAAAQEFYDDIQQRVVASGRPHGSTKIMAGTRFVIGDTAEDARERAEAELTQRLTPRLVISFIEDIWGQDLSDYDVDGPLPTIAPDPLHRPSVRVTTRAAGAERTSTGLAAQWRARADAEGKSMRQMVRALLSQDEKGLVGTASEIAERMVDLCDARAVDGFVVVPAVVPSGLAEFVDAVIPHLQERGAFREAYQADTLRGHLGVGLHDTVGAQC